MNNTKTKFIIAVTGRLSAAKESDAKVELIEELSENLNSRYEDMTASGVPAEEAFQRALGELGDVDELLAYLDSLGPKGKLPPQNRQKHIYMIDTDDLDQKMADLDRELEELDSELEDLEDEQEDNGHEDEDDDRERARFRPGRRNSDFAKSVREIVRGAVEAARDAVDMVQDAAGQFRGEVTFVTDEDKFHAAVSPDGSFAYTTGSSVSWEDGCSSADLRAVDVSLMDGDVTVRFDCDPDAPVRVEGETGGLLIQHNDGVLLIRQGKTAGDKFFFGRMLRSTDIELTVPRRQWESLTFRTANGDVELWEGAAAERLNVSTANGDVEIHPGLRAGQVKVSTANGDVELGEGLEAEQVCVETASGDANLQNAVFNRLVFKSASGDFSGDGLTGELRAESMSGDVSVSGSFPVVRCASASGDVEVCSDVLPKVLEVSSKSGDCQAAVPDGAGFTVQFRTVSGDMHSDFPLAGLVGKRSGEAVYLGGGDSSIRMSSVSGDVNLRRQP